MRRILFGLIFLCTFPLFSEIIRCKSTEKKLEELFIDHTAESGVPLKNEPEAWNMDYYDEDKTVYVPITSLKIYACDTIEEVNKIVSFKFTGERNYKSFTPYSNKIDKWKWETNAFSIDDISEDKKETSLAYQYYNLGKNEFGSARYVVIKMTDGYSTSEVIYEEVTRDFKIVTSVFLSDDNTIDKILSMEAK